MDAGKQAQIALDSLVKALDRLEKAASIHQQIKNTLASVQSERDLLLLERSVWEDSKNKTVSDSEVGEIKAQCDALKATRNRLVSEKNQLLAERENFKKFREGWAHERPLLLKSKEDLQAERLRLISERDRLIAEKQQICAPKEIVKIIDTPESIAKIESLTLERDALKQANEGFQDQENVEKERLMIELDGIKRAYADLKQTATEASERLEATLAQLKELRGDNT